MDAERNRTYNNHSHTGNDSFIPSRTMFYTERLRNREQSSDIINNSNNTEQSKLICVVCNPIQFKSTKNKAYKLFKIGFENNTLCYLNNLQNIITSYFN